MPFSRDPKSGIEKFTHRIYTQGIFLKSHSQHLSIEAFFADKPKNFAYMCSSEKKNLEQKNDLNRGGGEYRKFDEFSSQMRESVIKSYAENIIAHAAANGGICR
jgi:hypothetical protein